MCCYSSHLNPDWGLLPGLWAPLSSAAARGAAVRSHLLTHLLQELCCRRRCCSCTPCFCQSHLKHTQSPLTVLLVVSITHDHQRLSHTPFSHKWFTFDWDEPLIAERLQKPSEQESLKASERTELIQWVRRYHAEESVLLPAAAELNSFRTWWVKDPLDWKHDVPDVPDVWRVHYSQFEGGFTCCWSFSKEKQLKLFQLRSNLFFCCFF